TSGTGQFTLNNVLAGAYTVRSIAPAGFVAAGGYPVTVVAGATTSGVNVAHFATTYSGDAAANQFLLRRKAGDAKFEILVGGVLTYTVPATAVSSLTFNLLGGNDS